MTEKKDASGKEQSRPGDSAGPSRPHATLDLKATEIKSADVKAAGAASEARPGSSASKGAEAGAKDASVKEASTVASSAPSEQKTADAEAKSEAPIESGKPAKDSGAVRAPAARRGGVAGTAGHLLAGLAGGLIVLFGGDRLASLLGLPRASVEDQAAIVEFDKRVAALEKSVGAAPPASVVTDTMKSVDERLAKAEAELAAVAKLSEGQTKLAADVERLDAEGGSAAELADATSRLTKLEERIALLASAAGTEEDQGRIQGLAAITGRLADLETKVDSGLREIRSSALAAVDERAAPAVEASETARSGVQRLEREISGLRGDTARTQQRLEDQKAEGDRITAAVGVLKEDAASLSAALAELKSTVSAQLDGVARPADVASAVSPFSARIAALERSLDTVVAGEGARRENAGRILLALELANLKRAVESGRGYAVELANVRKIAGSSVDLGALDAAKETGLPTVSALSVELQPLVASILDASRPLPEGQTFADRLMASAMSVVRVRKVNPDDDDKSPEATLARMEAALTQGHLGDVIDIARALPPASLDVASPWLAKVEQRQAVDRAIVAVEADLKRSLATEGGAGPAAGEAPQN